MSYEVVAPELLEAYWPLAAPWIATALGHDTEAWEDLEFVRLGLLRGQFTLWIGYPERNNNLYRYMPRELDVVMVTEFFCRGKEVVCCIRWLSGKNMDDKIKDIALVENWALGKGAQRLEVWGRPGWERLLKPLCYKREFVVLSRDLTRSIN